VDQGGRVAAVRCRAALDLEAIYVGAAPGYRLEKTAQAGKTADAAEDVKRRGGVVSAGDGRRRGEEGGWVERLLEEVRREFSGFPRLRRRGGRLREEDCAYGQEAVQEVPRDV
jgi:hypothetical protein